MKDTRQLLPLLLLAAAAAADRRVPKAPPGIKTAKHGKTNKPQNRTEKMPNVPSETLLKLRDMRGLKPY